MCVKIKFIIDRNLANCDTPVFCLLSCKIPSSGRQSSVRASVLPCAHLTPGRHQPGFKFNKQNYCVLNHIMLYTISESSHQF